MRAVDQKPEYHLEWPAATTFSSTHMQALHSPPNLNLLFNMACVITKQGTGNLFLQKVMVACIAQFVFSLSKFP